MGERYSSVHDGVLVAGVGPVAVGGGERFCGVHGGVLVAGVGSVAVGGGERFSSVHGGVLVAGVGPVAVGGGSGLVVYTVVFSLQESGLSRWGGGAL